MKQMVGRTLRSTGFGSGQFAVLANFAEPQGGIDVYELGDDGDVDLIGGVIDEHGPVANRIVLRRPGGETAGEKLRRYAFVPLEKEQDFLVYDVSIPFAPQRIRNGKSGIITPKGHARTYCLEAEHGDTAGVMPGRCSASPRKAPQEDTGVDCFTVYLFTESGKIHRYAVAIDWAKLNAKWKHVEQTIQGTKSLSAKSTQCITFPCDGSQCTYTGVRMDIGKVTATNWIGRTLTHLTATAVCASQRPSQDNYIRDDTRGVQGRLIKGVKSGSPWAAQSVKNPYQCGAAGLTACVTNVNGHDGATVGNMRATLFQRVEGGTREWHPCKFSERVHLHSGGRVEAQASCPRHLDGPSSCTYKVGFTMHESGVWGCGGAQQWAISTECDGSTYVGNNLRTYDGDEASAVSSTPFRCHEYVTVSIINQNSHCKEFVSDATLDIDCHPVGTAARSRVTARHAKLTAAAATSPQLLFAAGGTVLCAVAAAAWCWRPSGDAALAPTGVCGEYGTV